jgi:ABC-type Fe3+ transport system permease subunit
MRAATLLCTLVCLLCAILLTRGYFRGRRRLLLWSALCFVGLTISNLFVFLDLIVWPDVDLYRFRLAAAALSMLLLLYGLIWEGE